MSAVLRAGLVQHACTADKPTNLDRSLAGIAEAAAQGARLAVLQELHAGLYFCQSEDVRHFDLAEPIPGPTTERLSQAAREHGIVIVASIFERRAPGVFHNTAVVIDTNGAIAGRYRKMHIPDDPGFYEKFYFTPGDLGFQPIDTSVGRLGVLVCWDQWFPEAARLMALAGAEVLIYPTAIGWEPNDNDAEKTRQLEAWTISQRAHAVANGLPVLSVNRVGHETDPYQPGPGIDFWGHSFAAGPQGELLATAPKDADAVVTVDLDRNRTEAVRRIWPFFRDRRIDAYGGLESRYRDEPATGGGSVIK